ncbi:unnamed protein product [Prorocentrum cordatum]|uniref:RING-type domain-containing protein n=1 Tax=Prorocentrum cordatum TaxID=2364126 RepID=A0ABN9TCD2_9DINO|nr:unnamed protein product [Polarella glacialis]
MAPPSAIGTPSRGVAASLGSRSASCERWRSAVARAQAAANLDMGSIERAQQRELCFRKCKAAKGLALRTRALVAETLSQMSQATAGMDFQTARERCATATAASRERHDRRHELLEKVQQGARRILSAGHSMERSRSPSPCSVQSEALMRGATSSDESAFQEAGVLVGAGSAGLMSSRAALQSESDSEGGCCPPAGPGGRGAGTSGPTKVDSLLQALRVEPADDLERAAKFGLYEAYFAEVESMRGILIKFHGESRPLLDQQMAAWMDKQLQDIDSKENMGISETRDWFVYHMMWQAHGNNRKMTSKLDLWEEKISSLCAVDQQPCPICLQGYTCDRPPQTLGCCHKSCTRCWGHWTTFMHGMGKPAFCPSCHRQEFLGSVSSPAEVAGVRAISPQSRGRSPPPPFGQYTESAAPADDVTAHGRAPLAPGSLTKISL